MRANHALLSRQSRLTMIDDLLLLSLLAQMELSLLLEACITHNSVRLNDCLAFTSGFHRSGAASSTY